MRRKRNKRKGSIRKKRERKVKKMNDVEEEDNVLNEFYLLRYNAG
jgi:hypothetical protein